MLKTRVIPCLLLKNAGLVKTIRFNHPTYVGDPINAVRIFNAKEVDELVLLDIDAAVAGRKPNYELISRVASECFMPLSYGGGVRDIDGFERILSIGVEKVVVNCAAIRNPDLIKTAAGIFGNQSIVVSMDVKRNGSGEYRVYSHNGKVEANLGPVDHAIRMEMMGAGEIFLNSIDRDGTMQGYDIELIERVAEAVSIPVIACGGAGKLRDFADAVGKGASAVSAGSMFVFHGKNRAVLINFPSPEELKQHLS